ncbi:MAG: NTPase [Deltaproteobacteria bacterium]|nr:NTPase [Deltaproteobacteria bacterium]
MFRLLLTGSPGVGKTTVIRRILKTIQGVQCAGFYTEERRERGQRRGFKICTLDGEEGILATTSPGKGPKVGKYTVNVGVFEELALPRIDLEETPAELYIIDEIGRMELESTRFRASIVELLAHPSNFLATIAKRGKGFLDQIKVRNDIEIIEVTKENRDQLPGAIAERIVNQLRS